MTIISGNWPTQ